MSACGFVYLQVSSLRKRVCKVFLRLFFTPEVNALEFHCIILYFNPWFRWVVLEVHSEKREHMSCMGYLMPPAGIAFHPRSFVGRQSAVLQ